MFTHLTRYVMFSIAATTSAGFIVACSTFGAVDGTTPFDLAKAEFDEVIVEAERDGMVPSVPADLVVMGFSRSDEGVYKTSFVEPDGDDAERLELNHVAIVCVGPNPEELDRECGTQTETDSSEVQSLGDGLYLLVFPEDALSQEVQVSDDGASLTQAFDRGWTFWAPETTPS